MNNQAPCTKYLNWENFYKIRSGFFSLIEKAILEGERGSCQRDIENHTNLALYANIQNCRKLSAITSVRRNDFPLRCDFGRINSKNFHVFYIWKIYKIYFVVKNCKKKKYIKNRIRGENKSTGGRWSFL